MIYKFKAKQEGAHVEVSKENDSVKISMHDNEDIFVLEISKETLYDFIGSLHSIQTKIKNDNEFERLSKSF